MRIFVTVKPHAKSEAIEQISPAHFSISVEPHGLTPVASLRTLRRAEPSETYPPSPRLRRIPSFIPAFTGWAFSARIRSRRRVKEPSREGKTNRAVAQALAGYLEISIERITLRSGASGKRKVFEIKKF